MWDVIVNTANNMGFAIEHIILIVVMTGCLIFYAKDFKIGLSLQMFFSGLLFLWFYNETNPRMNWAPSLTIFFICIILLSLSLYAQSKSVQQGSIV